MGLCMEELVISLLSYYKKVVFHLYEKRLSSNAYEKCDERISKRNEMSKKKNEESEPI